MKTADLHIDVNQPKTSTQSQMHGSPSGGQGTARSLFYQTDLSKQKIADILGISRRTVQRWAKEGDWVRIKYHASHRPSQLVEQYSEQLLALNLAISCRTYPWPTPAESATIRKISTTMKQLKPNKQTTAEAIDTFMFFTDDLKKENPGLQEQLQPYLYKFIQKLSNTGHLSNYDHFRMEQQEIDEAYEQELADEEHTQYRTPAPWDGSYAPEECSDMLPGLSHHNTTLTPGEVSDLRNISSPLPVRRGGERSGEVPPSAAGSEALLVTPCDIQCDTENAITNTSESTENANTKPENVAFVTTKKITQTATFDNSISTQPATPPSHKNGAKLTDTDLDTLLTPAGISRTLTDEEHQALREKNRRETDRLLERWEKMKHLF